MREELRIDPAKEAERVEAFIRAELADAGLSKIVVGLSGGLDSAVVAFLCARAIAPENVFALLMPHETSSPESIEHAEAVANAAGIAHETIEITAAVEALADMLPTDDRVRRGNTMARVRMITLYDQSARRGALVAGTGNRTESLLGYTTLHGDSACGFRPIAHLYKCQVRQLARFLGVPDGVIAKPPSADLWEGQTDEGELGFSYDDVDWLLHNMMDQAKTDSELAAMGFPADFVARVRSLVEKSEFKRRMPRGLN